MKIVIISLLFLIVLCNALKIGDKACVQAGLRLRWNEPQIYNERY